MAQRFARVIRVIFVCNCVHACTILRVCCVHIIDVRRSPLTHSRCREVEPFSASAGIYLMPTNRVIGSIRHTSAVRRRPLTRYEVRTWMGLHKGSPNLVSSNCFPPPTQDVLITSWWANFDHTRALNVKRRC